MADKFFWTQYTPPQTVFNKGGTARYGTGVWAADLKEAYELVDQRNVTGEYVEDIFQPSKGACYEPVHTHVEKALDNRKNRKCFTNALHGITFLCYLGSCVGLTADETLGDGGLLHEFIHIMTTTDDPYAEHKWYRKEHILIAVLEVELKVPGYLSREQKEHAIRYQNTLQERITRQA